MEGWCLTPRRNINSPQLQLGNNQTKVKPARDTNEGQASDIRRQEEQEHFWNELCHYCRGNRRSCQILPALVGAMKCVAERRGLFVSLCSLCPQVYGIWGLEACSQDILCAFLSVLLNVNSTPEEESCWVALLVFCLFQPLDTSLSVLLLNTPRIRKNTNCNQCSSFQA